ncbi:phasin family protein [Paenibacillus sp. GD4]|jgi:polyhydroxyalkanoate synthesis regulator phasin|uniref:phasin family protein n=1 Tax=Paenibacillus sp. GD4 TaxID=3068890 RepID=UPI0027964EAB|nr:phasin family protein [Paenibacillus sp. GD4]MDQ1910098.1 phasin family protein [Paenibacillus sp. GD4]
MNDLFRKALSLGVGITVLSKEKIEQLVEDLVKKGDVAPDESKELVTRLVEKGEQQQSEIKRMVREQLQKVMSELQVATKEDIARLEQRIEKLETPTS